MINKKHLSKCKITFRKDKMIKAKFFKYRNYEGSKKEIHDCAK